MKPRVPAWILASGSTIIVISIYSKKFFPTSFAHTFAFQWSCAIISAILLSLALFLSLYGLLTEPAYRKQFFGLHLAALAMLCWMLSFCFFGYVIMTKIDSVTKSIPNVLPEMVENARRLEPAERRLKVAEGAYEICGVEIAYRNENDALVYYEPTKKAMDLRRQIGKGDANKVQLELILQEQLKQYPYLLAFYIGAFFLTFFIGSLWIVFKKSNLEPNLQP
jgi:hypothetical protein